MLNLIKTEWLKIKNYPAFWWIICITALSYPGINYTFLSIYHNITAKQTMQSQIVKALVGNPFSFPEAWHTVAFFSSLFIFIPAIVVIMLITNEYTYKTNRQNIIDGWSRSQFMWSKFISVVIITLIVSVIYFVVSLIIGSTNTDNVNASKWDQFYYVLLFAFQTFAQLSIAFLIGLLVRKSFIALAIFIFYFIILEPILVGVLKYKAHDIGRFLPLEISDRLIPVPAFLGKIDADTYKAALAAIQSHVFLTLTGLLITWGLSLLVYMRRDL
jgi:ABC-type transport system involved in multi-copper enzyme maturation permease subunit